MAPGKQGPAELSRSALLTLILWLPGSSRICCCSLSPRCSIACSDAFFCELGALDIICVVMCCSIRGIVRNHCVASRTLLGVMRRWSQNTSSLDVSLWYLFLREFALSCGVRRRTECRCFFSRKSIKRRMLPPTVSPRLWAAGLFPFGGILRFAGIGNSHYFRL
jgi:hypothetical protein